MTYVHTYNKTNLKIFRVFHQGAPEPQGVGFGLKQPQTNPEGKASLLCYFLPLKGGESIAGRQTRESEGMHGRVSITER